MKSVRGIEYDLIAALRRNPTIIQAGDDICGKAADEIERLRAALTSIDAVAHPYTGDTGISDQASRGLLYRCGAIAEAALSEADKQ